MKVLIVVLMTSLMLAAQSKPSLARQLASLKQQLSSCQGSLKESNDNFQKLFLQAGNAPTFSPVSIDGRTVKSESEFIDAFNALAAERNALAAIAAGLSQPRFVNLTVNGEDPNMSCYVLRNDGNTISIDCSRY